MSALATRPEPRRMLRAAALAGAPWLAVALLARLVPLGAWAGPAIVVVVLVPGLALWRALVRGRALEPALELAAGTCVGAAAVGAALLLAAAAHQPIAALCAGLAVVSVAAAAFAGRRPLELAPGARRELVWIGGIGAAALPFGVLAARLVRLDRDTLYHLGRVRHLAQTGDLWLGSNTDLVNGSVHPGYAVPLWHAAVAGAARLAGLDAAVAYRWAAVGLVPLAALLVWALVRLATGSSAAGAVAAAASISVGLSGGGGRWSLLSEPGSAAVGILAVALLAVIVADRFERRGANVAALAAGAAAITLIHPTYAPFVAVVLVGIALSERLAGVGMPWRPELARLAALVLPFLAFALAIQPLARQVAQRQSAGSLYQGGIDKWVAQGQVLRVGGMVMADPRLLALGITGGLAALTLLPLVAVVLERRTAAIVVGAVAGVLVVVLAPPLFTELTRLFFNQARRLGAFAPRELALAAGVLAVATLVQRLRAPARAVAAVALVLLGLADAQLGRSGGAAWPVTVAALALGLLAVALVARRRRHGLEPSGRPPAQLVLLLGACLVLPGAAATLADARDALAQPPADRGLPAGVVAALRSLPAGSGVLSDVPTSYEIPAAADLRIYAGPVAHVANTRSNAPYQRVATVHEILSPRTDPQRRDALIAASGAGYLLLRPALAHRLGAALRASTVLAGERRLPGGWRLWRIRAAGAPPSVS